MISKERTDVFINSLDSGNSPFLDEIEEANYAGIMAGAQWMAEQGITREAEIEVHGDVGWVKSGTSIISTPDGYFKDGDKIIIQVRRKENSDD